MLHVYSRVTALALNASLVQSLQNTSTEEVKLVSKQKPHHLQHSKYFVVQI